MMDGLTTKSPAELLPLAKSWLTPPKLQLQGSTYRNDGYDATQRAYVVTRKPAKASDPLAVVLDASDASPIVDPAIVIQDWGEGDARIDIDGKSAGLGKDCRIGHVHRLDGTDLVIWMQRQATKPIKIRVAPAGSSAAR